MRKYIAQFPVLLVFFTHFSASDANLMFTYGYNIKARIYKCNILGAFKAQISNLSMPLATQFL
jgi:hypothetical protein